ncbi:Protein phosphatase 1 regulatory subunit 3D [Ceratocystis lukuohia]|uniref:Protein phosphatase 1 regulatory subunit 3D n=1 Tax=Ceratocystis lukuohia TaxID=2019550 RepID=A0ABR4ME08_9PEZI
MPYTPPSHSPAASPVASRRSSYSSSPALPRSAHYLRKHRRSPSAPVSTPSSPSPSRTSSTGTASLVDSSFPAATSAQSVQDSKGCSSLSTSSSTSFSTSVSDPSSKTSSSTPTSSTMAAATMTMNVTPVHLLAPMTLSIPASLSVRQSPPPVTPGHAIPSGAVISPPESASDSDEDGLEIRGRDRQSLKNLKMSICPPAMEVSPDMISNSNSTKSDGPSFVLSPKRDGNEPNVSVSTPRSSSENAIDGTDEETDAEIYKPKMVRKKSGELVRPALRPSSKSRRAISAPGTPTFSKAVHFDSQLEHVRHFLQVDRPAAVSAGSSPNENYESETEYPFYDRKTVAEPPFSWEMITSNFPASSVYRQSQPICLEKVWLSADQKSLVGSVAVANMAFQKLVVCRFTFDYWKTTSEVVADYSCPVVPKMYAQGTDRFTFAIRLSDTANLESKTMYLCMRYSINGTEYWDNNTHLNFQVDFRKKYQKQNGKYAFQGNKTKPVQVHNQPNALPRSSRSNSGANRMKGGAPNTGSSQNSLPRSSHARSKSMPAGVNFEDLSISSKSPPTDIKTTSAASTKASVIQGLLDDEPITIRLKQPQRNGSPDKNENSSGMAFANRYDFGASLSAARMELNPNKMKVKSVKKATSRPDAMPSTNMPATNGSGARSSLASTSYEELVNKYCFFSSKPSGASTDSKAHRHHQSASAISCQAQVQPAANVLGHGRSFSHTTPHNYATKSHASTVSNHNLKPLQEAALRCQQAMLGFPPNRQQALAPAVQAPPPPLPQTRLQQQASDFVPIDGSVTPPTPSSSNGSSPTITSVSPSSPVSPPTVLSTGLPAAENQNVKNFGNGMHERLPFEQWATALTG